MQKTELKNLHFFNEISSEYKETKFPQDYMERGKSQTSLTETLNARAVVAHIQQYEINNHKQVPKINFLF